MVLLHSLHFELEEHLVQLVLSESFEIWNFGDDLLQSALVLIIVLIHCFFELVLYIRIIECHFLELSLVHFSKSRVLLTDHSHGSSTVEDSSNLAEMVTMS